MRRALKLHPQSSCAAVTVLEVEARRRGRAGLELRFVLSGSLDGLVLPPPAASARADELWRRTCMEAFVRGGPGEAYLELNLGPSGQWAAYRFDRRREGMADAQIPAPEIEVRRGADRLELRAGVDLGPAAAALGQGAWRIGLSAVVEETGGRLSYWALAHPAGKPDFHHPDCFALELPAPDGP